MSTRARGRTALYRALIALGLVLVCCLGPQSAAADLTVTFIDVGQGDAIVLRDSQGWTVLIDGGRREAAARVLAALPDEATPDVLVWTHGHADHIGGLIEVVERRGARRIAYNGLPFGSDAFGQLWQAVQSLQVPIDVGVPGDTYTWGETEVLALHPGRRYSNENDNSLVLRVLHGEVTFLLTGDAEAAAERAMLQQAITFPQRPLQVQVLKVGHHGSSTSSGADFLDAVRPEAAIISVGPNAHGHPADETLQRLQARGTSVYRTDHHGTIIVASTGLTYTLTTTYIYGPRAYLPLMVAPGSP